MPRSPSCEGIRAIATESGLVVGDDGLARCPWGAAPADYRAYHDREWGRAVRGDREIFERLSLEAFQSGLSWITILRKREAFRAAFAGFDPRTVSTYDDGDVERLLANAGIVRNRAKIEATIANARTLLAWHAEEGDDALDSLVWSLASPAEGPVTLADVPSASHASRELARLLRARGWRFLGPTTGYAALQAMGVVNDHLVGCHARGASGPGTGPVGNNGARPPQAARSPRAAAGSPRTPV